MENDLEETSVTEMEIKLVTSKEVNREIKSNTNPKRLLDKISLQEYRKTYRTRQI